MELTKLREKMNAKKKIEVTYKQLCELIDEPEIRGGNQREKQKKGWKKYFDFTINKDKKYIITKIYEEPLPEDPEKIKDKLMNYNICLELLKQFCKKETKGKTNKEITTIYNHYVHSNEGVTIQITKLELAIRLGLVNENFKKYIGSHNELAKKLKIQKGVVDEFYNKVIKGYSKDIKTALEKLENNKVIMVEEGYKGIIPYNEQTYLMYKLNKYDDETADIEYEYDLYVRDLTEDEKNTYIEISTELLKSYNCKDLGEYIKLKNGDTTSYYKELDRRVYNKMGIKKVYKIYKITFSPSFIFERKKGLENQLTKMFANRIINNKKEDIVKKINEINKEVDKECEKYFLKKNKKSETNEKNEKNRIEYLLEQKEGLEQSEQAFIKLINMTIKNYKRKV